MRSLTGASCAERRAWHERFVYDCSARSGSNHGARSRRTASFRQHTMTDDRTRQRRSVKVGSEGGGSSRAGSVAARRRRATPTSPGCSTIALHPATRPTYRERNSARRVFSTSCPNVLQGEDLAPGRKKQLPHVLAAHTEAASGGPMQMHSHYSAPSRLHSFSVGGWAVVRLRTIFVGRIS